MVDEVAGSGKPAEGASSPETGGPVPELPPGHTLGGVYSIRSLLRHGTMGRVYEAQDEVLSRRVELKVPLDTRATDALLSEGQVLAALSHPSLPQVHAAGRQDGLHFLVMERLVGTNLEQHLVRNYQAGRPLQLAEVLGLLVAVCDALHTIHHAGLVHRDIKPEHVLLCGERGTVLSDFGLMIAEGELAGSHALVHGGSPHYMAPEAFARSSARGEGHLADLYSFGVLAFELCTGSVPYNAGDVAGLRRLHEEAPIPDPRMLRPNIPVSLAELIVELLAKKPGGRPQTAEEVLWRLRPIAADVSQRPVSQRPIALVVCDDLGFASELRHRLEHWVLRVQVVVCASGEAALAELARATPQLMLLDLEIGGMGGLGLLKRIRKADVEPPEAMVALTEQPRPEDLEALRSLEVRSVVQRGKAMGTMLEPVVRNVLATANLPGSPFISQAPPVSKAPPVSTPPPLSKPPAVSGHPAVSKPPQSSKPPPVSKPPASG